MDKRDPQDVAIGRRIRQIRTERSLTQEQVGELVAVSRVHITQIETGRVSASTPVLRRIASALGVRWERGAMAIQHPTILRLALDRLAQLHKP